MIYKMGSKRYNKRIDNPGIKAVVIHGSRKSDVSIVNISRSGLRFRSGEICAKGDKLRFELTVGEGELSFSLSMRARVLNVYEDEGENGMHEYGVKFLRFFYWHEMSLIEKHIIFPHYKQTRLADIDEDEFEENPHL